MKIKVINILKKELQNIYHIEKLGREEFCDVFFGFNFKFKDYRRICDDEIKIDDIRIRGIILNAFWAYIKRFKKTC
ncbi:hypothetical protein Glove_350g113 [Diversispora epigaea]|uniref:Uncharacterized protein n=1 Tax=Diversispora epigaea TaxID=1348612 RepID=A0A397HDB8_9GLOM|nr:hypothetical protein Glove_350g113 [Diversispora epigaea]